MTTQELKEQLIKANDTRRNGPRTPDEVEAILKKFEESEKQRIKNIAVLKEQNKGYHARVKDMILENNINLKDTRFYVTNLMGIFVYRKPNGKATVTFSFYNVNDYEEGKTKLSDWSFKFHALQNYLLNRYTYEVDWKGRSEFAVYDAFVINHKAFPSHYKCLSINVGFFNPFLKRSDIVK